MQTCCFYQLVTLKYDYCCVSGELIGVEYLYSQQCKEVGEDIGHDPDAPDGTPDDESEWEDDGFDEEAYLGEEEESDPTIAPLSVADPRRGLLSIHAEAEAETPLPSEDAPSDLVLPSPAIATSGVGDDGPDDVRTAQIKKSCMSSVNLNEIHLFSSCFSFILSGIQRS